MYRIECSRLGRASGSDILPGSPLIYDGMAVGWAKCRARVHALCFVCAPKLRSFNLCIGFDFASINISMCRDPCRMFLLIVVQNAVPECECVVCTINILRSKWTFSMCHFQPLLFLSPTRYCRTRNCMDQKWKRINDDATYFRATYAKGPLNIMSACRWTNLCRQVNTISPGLRIYENERVSHPRIENASKRL